MKILYVEDEIAHVVLAHRTLEENLRQQFKLIHAETIADALKLAGTRVGCGACWLYGGLSKRSWQCQRQSGGNR